MTLLTLLPIKPKTIKKIKYTIPLYSSGGKFKAEFIAPIPAMLQHTIQKWKNCSKAFIKTKN